MRTRRRENWSRPSKRDAGTGFDRVRAVRFDDVGVAAGEAGDAGNRATP